MHTNSMILMNEFIEKYDLQKATVVDIGSYDINGNYRGFFLEGKYIGVDIQPGPNVDILMGSEEWNKIENVDAVISGQTIEHVADIPVWMTAIYMVLKPGGLLCIIAPSAGPPAHYPIWVGLFSEERMSEVVTAGGFEILSCTVSDVGMFNDTCCVARKPQSIMKNRRERNEDK